MPGNRHPNRRAIKRHYNYTVDEAARALNVSKATIRRWINKGGLTVLMDRKPILILADDLIDFLSRRSAPRRHCGPGECYCVKCRAPRAAAGGMAEFIPYPPAGGNLRAICDVCETLMHRRVSNCQLEAFKTILDVFVAEAPPHIRERE